MAKIITNIVFTKNRPLQLEAYLQSFFRYFPKEQVELYVIHKVELFENEYNEVFKQYPWCHIIKENDFHSDLLNVLYSVKTKYVLFGIDDVVYFDSVDLNLVNGTFETKGEEVFGFTFRFSPEFLKNSGEEIKEEVIGGQKVYKLNWKKGKSVHAYYPFELCATVYKTEFVKEILSNTMNNNIAARKLFSPDSGIIKLYSKIHSPRSLLKKFGYFFNPNTLESWPCRWCKNNADKLPDYTYFQKLCETAIQVNMVNTSTNNTFDGGAEHTVGSLNEKYKQGYRFDIESLSQNRPKQLSCGKEYFKLKLEKKQDRSVSVLSKVSQAE